MDKTRNALNEFGMMDEFAAGDSPIHRLNATAKLLCTVSYILVVMSFGKYSLSALSVMILWPVLLFQLSGIPMGACFYKLRMILPLVMAVGLFNPFFDRGIMLTLWGIGISGGVVSMLTLMLKGILCLMASFLLAATTPFDSICASLSKLHVPGTLVTLFLLTYRYIGVLGRELAIMSDAYHLRAPGQKGIHVSAWGSFLGQLLLRSMDRAQELYSSMLLRGYHKHFHYAPTKPFRWKDFFFLFSGISFFLLFRMVDVASILGSLFVSVR